MKTFFLSDLHGSRHRYNKLFRLIMDIMPQLVLLGGDLLPFSYNGFIENFLRPNLQAVKKHLGTNYPEIMLICGNDDPKKYLPELLDGEEAGLWKHMHNKRVSLDGCSIYGYAYSPPSPFQLKDWEKYDVSRYVDPGCVSPEDGSYSIPIPEEEIKFSTMKKDIQQLVGKDDLTKSIFLFHSPPYLTNLDRAALDDKSFEHVPLDVHVGSIAIKKFIESRQPYLTLHGHIHESTEITGSWKDQIGRTICFNAAHKGKELSLIKFDTENLSCAERVLIDL